ncbi:MAG: peptidoglycan DD-metalloendopeptidase family protein [Pseudomonadota bacterium]
MTLRTTLILGASAIALAACQGVDLSSLRNGIDRRPDTAGSAQNVAPRPKPDARGVISYPNYQVIVANGGETMDELAGRVGMTGADLARHNGLPVTYRPRGGEVLALPKGIVTPAGQTDTANSTTNLESIASTAIGRADGQTTTTTAAVQQGPEPIRHVVEPGETAYSIARLYDVSVNSLASWNGLGKDLEIRNGQQLLIPVVADGSPRRDVAAAATQPGDGSPTPLPPSSVDPLPDPDEVKSSPVPKSPNLVEQRTASSNVPKMQRPVSGKVLRGYSTKPGGNEGIDFAAPKGASVQAADDGEVALVSSAGSNTKIVLIRHPGNVYTVYSNVSNVAVKKGQKVSRGATVGKVAGGSPSFVHFEIRKGTESVDPTPYF